MRIVTIARAFGAGGHTVGQEVSKKLGFELVEKEIVDAVAKKAKVSPGWVKAIEKERGNQLINFINSLVSINFLDPIALSSLLVPFNISSYALLTCKNGKAVLSPKF